MKYWDTSIADVVHQYKDIQHQPYLLSAFIRENMLKFVEFIYGWYCINIEKDDEDQVYYHVHLSEMWPREENFNTEKAIHTHSSHLAPWVLDFITSNDKIRDSMALDFEDYFNDN